MIQFMIICWNLWAGFRLKIENLHCFFGNFNGHHSDRLRSSRSDVHGVATCDFAALSGCTKLVHGSTHRACSIADLVMSDVPDLCKV